MPKKTLDLDLQVAHLSILAQDGTLDAALEPALPDEMLLKMYRAMLLGRRFDERMLKLQRQGRIGTFAPIKGQEASQVGAIAALRESDWMVPAFRETAAELWRGRTLESVLRYFGGYDEGGYVPEGINTLPISVPVGSQPLHAVGIAWAIKYRGLDDIAMTFFGDGATSQGDFHEALNFAGVYQLPLVFVCQNNQWAISVPRSKQTRSETIAQKALAYGVPGVQVDGNDILAMYVASKEAVDRARAGGGPTLIEAVTYRVTMHTTADDPKRYRTEEEEAVWLERDPLMRFQKYLLDRGVLDEDQLAALADDVRQEIQEAVARAEALMNESVDPLTMFDHHYEVMPAHLLRQREELAQALAAKEVNHG